MENSHVCTDAELNRYIVASAAELYGIIIQKFGANYAIKTYSFATDGINTDYDLPADFLKSAKVEMQSCAVPGAWDPVERIELAQQHLYSVPWAQGPSLYMRCRYLLWGAYGATDQIRLLPLFTSGWPMRVYYVPRMTPPADSATALLSGVVATNTLTINSVVFTCVASGATGNQFNVGLTDAATATNLAAAIAGSVTAGISGTFTASSSGALVTVTVADDAMLTAQTVTWSASAHMTLTPSDGWTNVLDGLNRWEELIVIDAAIKALAKQDLDVSVLGARKGAILRRIEDEASSRDSGSPVCIADTMGYDGGGSRVGLFGYPGGGR